MNHQHRHVPDPETDPDGHPVTECSAGLCGFAPGELEAELTGPRPMLLITAEPGRDPRTPAGWVITGAWQMDAYTAPGLVQQVGEILATGELTSDLLRDDTPTAGPGQLFTLPGTARWALLDLNVPPPPGDGPVALASARYHLDLAMQSVTRQAVQIADLEAGLARAWRAVDEGGSALLAAYADQAAADALTDVQVRPGSGWLASLAELNVAIRHDDGTWKDDISVRAELGAWLAAHGVDPRDPAQAGADPQADRWVIPIPHDGEGIIVLDAYRAPRGGHPPGADPPRPLTGAELARWLEARRWPADRVLEQAGHPPGEHGHTGAARWRAAMADAAAHPASPDDVVEADIVDDDRPAFTGQPDYDLTGLPVTEAGHGYSAGQREAPLSERAATEVREVLGRQARMVTYHGDGLGLIIHGTPPGDVVIEDGGGALLARLANAGYRKSPTGFGWGYEGSGPAALARSILAAALGTDAACPACHGSGAVRLGGGAEDPDGTMPCPACDDGIRSLPYQQYKRAVVARLDGEWRIRLSDVMHWLSAMPGDPLAEVAGRRLR
jgi:uncharacterized protein DUF6166